MIKSNHKNGLKTLSVESEKGGQSFAENKCKPKKSVRQRNRKARAQQQLRSAISFAAKIIVKNEVKVRVKVAGVVGWVEVGGAKNC